MQCTLSNSTDAVGSLKICFMFLYRILSFLFNYSGLSGEKKKNFKQVTLIYIILYDFFVLFKKVVKWEAPQYIIRKYVNDVLVLLMKVH